MQHMDEFGLGCARQYKNYRNVINLCNHMDEFGLASTPCLLFLSKVELAGKDESGQSPCDSIVGVVKRHVAKRSLQRQFE